MENPVTGLQLADLLLFTVTLIVCIAWAHFRVRRDFWFMVNPILYALHGTTFYVTLILDRTFVWAGTEWISFQSWSAMLRLHSVFATLAMVLFLISKRRINGAATE